MTELRCVPCLKAWLKRYGLNIPAEGMLRSGAKHADVIHKGEALCLEHFAAKQPSRKNAGVKPE